MASASTYATWEEVRGSTSGAGIVEPPPIIGHGTSRCTIGVRSRARLLLATSPAGGASGDRFRRRGRRRGRGFVAQWIQSSRSIHKQRNAQRRSDLKVSLNRCSWTLPAHKENGRDGGVGCQLDTRPFLLSRAAIRKVLQQKRGCQYSRMNINFSSPLLRSVHLYRSPIIVSRVTSSQTCPATPSSRLLSPTRSPVLRPRKIEIPAVRLRSRAVEVFPNRPKHVVKTGRQTAHVQETADFHAGEVVIVKTSTSKILERVGVGIADATVASDVSTNFCTYGDRCGVGSPARVLVCLSQIELDGHDVGTVCEAGVAHEA